MTITLRNDFHGTQVRLRPRVDSRGILHLSPRQVTRAKRALCVEGCTCSGALGNRGPQESTFVLRQETPEGGFMIEEWHRTEKEG